MFYLISPLLNHFLDSSAALHKGLNSQCFCIWNYFYKFSSSKKFFHLKDLGRIHLTKMLSAIAHTLARHLCSLGTAWLRAVRHVIAEKQVVEIQFFFSLDFKIPFWRALKINCLKSIGAQKTSWMRNSNMPQNKPKEEGGELPSRRDALLQFIDSVECHIFNHYPFLQGYKYFCSHLCAPVFDLHRRSLKHHTKLIHSFAQRWQIFYACLISLIVCLISIICLVDCVELVLEISFRISIHSDNIVLSLRTCTISMYLSIFFYLSHRLLHFKKDFF